MKFSTHTLAIILQFAIALADSSRVEFTSLNPHEKRNAFSGLIRGRRVDSTAVTTFRFALKQRNLDHGYEYLMNISDPKSPHYGKLWTAEQVHEKFAPSRESIETVQQWLISEGAERVSESKGWLSFESSIGFVENLLKAEYFEYRNHGDDTNGMVRLGCDLYHLPHHISKNVDFITPAVSLSLPTSKLATAKRQPLSKTDPRPWWPDQEEASQMQHAARRRLSSHTRDDINDLNAEFHPCGGHMTPACIRALYRLPGPRERHASHSNITNAIAVFESGGGYNQSDLDLFYRRYAPEIPSGTGPIPDATNEPPLTQGKHERPTNDETNLDLMMIYPIVYPQPVTIYQVPAKTNRHFYPSPNEFPYLIQEFVDALDPAYCSYNPIPGYNAKDCGAYSPTQVISISYGSKEIVFPELFLQRLCHEFMKLALRGVTVTVASGDWGVGGTAALDKKKAALTNGCIVAGDITATNSSLAGRNGTVFQMDFPSTCPYVLSVGGTQLLGNDSVRDAETVMDEVCGDPENDNNRFSSGGGFSNYFSRPAYQHAAVESYFSRHDPGYPYYVFNGVDFASPNNNIGVGGGLYNRAGRGVPDVSAIARHIPFIYNGKHESGIGTSAAAPIWASIFALINEERSNVGKGPVGFVNPVLYAHPEVFNDITKGRNPGCFTKGYSAVDGWDPVTGLGTPDYPKLLKVFMDLP